MPRRVSRSELTVAFFTSRAFWPERAFLAYGLDKRTSDEDLRRLAETGEGRFAAWTVEAATDDQILLCDFLSYTRAWLMVAPEGDGTGLRFGTAIIRRRRDRAGPKRLTTGFATILPGHRVYSRTLLSSARHRLMRTASP